MTRSDLGRRTAQAGWERTEGKWPLEANIPQVGQQESPRQSDQDSHLGIPCWATPLCRTAAPHSHCEHQTCPTPKECLIYRQLQVRVFNLPRAPQVPIPSDLAEEDLSSEPADLPKRGVKGHTWAGLAGRYQKPLQHS